MSHYQLMNESQIKDKLSSFQCPVDKGYPQLVTPLTYYTRVDGEEILAYSSFSDLGTFYFVGNTYVLPKNRGQGIYGDLLTNRNNHLNDKPKITIVNPIEGTDIDILHRQVAKQGGVKINLYIQVADFMSKELYTELRDLPIYFYR